MAAAKLRAVVFDLDGVITGTAKVHALAWESMFNDFLKARAEEKETEYVPFDLDEDYLQWVDGKPRPQGVESFLGSRGIELPFGDLDAHPQHLLGFPAIDGQHLVRTQPVDPLLKVVVELIGATRVLVFFGLLGLERAPL